MIMVSSANLLPSSYPINRHLLKIIIFRHYLLYKNSKFYCCNMPQWGSTKSTWIGKKKKLRCMCSDLVLFIVLQKKILQTQYLTDFNFLIWKQIVLKKTGPFQTCLLSTKQTFIEQFRVKDFSSSVNMTISSSRHRWSWEEQPAQQSQLRSMLSSSAESFSKMIKCHIQKMTRSVW